MDLKNQLFQIIREEANENGVSITQELTLDSNLVDELNFDSIMVLQLVLRLEDEFGIDMEDEDINHELFEKIGNLVQYLEKNSNKDQQVS
ncbi:hypothetical protein H1Z61_04265 [Bacillus aquiflavi]|uniref:Carrier domain-containing protein n=1 Tax=Bacillus aquiflavi TaxID=2672567 RepID=A0A6B3VZH3_9BACI|nr:phosphopantetheine-binding protein [Bacillus aquiflavi]MBA4536376.1 hypothetical protein [Bacillus aquiflavi]NEY80744.1 hypothetical protein [Bacillus aquiflavi]UAC48069.1 acyl carrier protein [Bacillus aquiflavi]